jgi:hypothetical protein
MANIPVNFGGVVLSAGQSIVGQFAGLIVLGATSTQVLTMDGTEIKLRYGAGLNSAGQVINSTATSNLILPPGTTLPLFITQCEVISGASVILYT